MGELEPEAEKTRPEIATYLREFADRLDSDGDVTLELVRRRDAQPSEEGSLDTTTEGD